MLLPITSRLLLEAWRPDSPCWKLMSFSLVSVEGLDGAVGDRPGARELEVEAVAAGAHRVDAVAHQRGHRHRHAAARGADAEGEAAGVGRRAGGPVEAVHAGA